MHLDESYSVTPLKEALHSLKAKQTPSHSSTEVEKKMKKNSTHVTAHIFANVAHIVFFILTNSAHCGIPSPKGFQFMLYQHKAANSIKIPPSVFTDQ